LKLRHIDPALDRSGSVLKAERRLSQTLAFLAYQAVWCLAAPLYLARLWWRGRREAGYRAHIAERLGLLPQFALSLDAEVKSSWVWIHAVSLGETRAAQALVDELRQRWPDVRIWLTHSTATGREAGRSLLRPGDGQSWLPMDGCGAPQRFLRDLRPRVGILMETEVWPGLQRAAEDSAVPMVLANARLSERSLRKGLRWSALMGPAVRSLTRALAQTPDDAQRLRTLGAQDVRVCGNLKFDVRPADALCSIGRSWRRSLGRPVILLASSREGEEAELLEQWADPERRAQRNRLALQPLLLIVPRHPQRFDAVARLIREARLSLWRRSEGGPMADAARGSMRADAASAEVWLGDSLGEMPSYYSLADVALLGGSFGAFGGQNLIEAAACGCPVLMGPHTFNFLEAAAQSEAVGAAQRVASMAEALQQALALIDASAVSDPGQLTPLAQMRLASDRFNQQHRGAAARMVEELADVMQPSQRAAAKRSD
jgi:3-deoxy-D-manno-octulosonic-acid transferase